MAALKDAWGLHKEISDQIAKGDGKYSSKEDLGKLVEELRRENKMRSTLGKSYGLTEADMALIDKQFEILYLPKSSTDILTDLTVNADYAGLDAFMLGFGGEAFNVEAVKSIISRDGSIPSEIYSIDDDYSTASKFGSASECTYGITLNHELERATVVFRGSIALIDFVTDVRFDDTGFDLPTADDPAKTNHGRVHEGFYYSLYGATKLGVEGNNLCQSQKILGKLQKLFIKYPDYTLWVTGHSLGAAQSSLFAFQAAMHVGIPNRPVMNVSFASPFVGDDTFQKEFQDLESKGLIRYLRVSNEDDVVPLVPFATPDVPPKLYKHVGMNVKLYNKT
jgi:hypothetical protein